MSSEDMNYRDCRRRRQRSTSNRCGRMISTDEMVCVRRRLSSSSSIIMVLSSVFIIVATAMIVMFTAPVTALAEQSQLIKSPPSIQSLASLSSTTMARSSSTSMLLRGHANNNKDKPIHESNYSNKENNNEQNAHDNNNDQPKSSLPKNFLRWRSLSQVQNEQQIKTNDDFSNTGTYVHFRPFGIQLGPITLPLPPHWLHLHQL